MKGKKASRKPSSSKKAGRGGGIKPSMVKKHRSSGVSRSGSRGGGGSKAGFWGTLLGTSESEESTDGQ